MEGLRQPSLTQVHEASRQADNRPVTERIKTFEDACNELGEAHPLVLQYRLNYSKGGWNDNGYASKFEAYLKLRIICAALNEGWEPGFKKDKCRYYPWFHLHTQRKIDGVDEDGKQGLIFISPGDCPMDYAGPGSACSAYVPSGTFAYIGSRLCLKSETLAVYCGRQFIGIWADYYLITK